MEANTACLHKSKKNKGGRPPLSKNTRNLLLHKIEPYLKKGLSIRKSVYLAKIPRSTFYRIMTKDKQFRDQISRFCNYIEAIYCKAILHELERINKKQQGNIKKNIPPKVLSRKERTFIFWIARHSSLVTEEYGRKRKIAIDDPEEYLRKFKI